MFLNQKPISPHVIARVTAISKSRFFLFTMEFQYTGNLRSIFLPSILVLEHSGMA